jgi:glycine oxidase
LQILIVGAGVIGAAIAEALAVRGADVTVLDMRGAGRGASQASAGILAPFTEAQPGSPLLALGSRSLDLFDGFIDALRSRSGRDVEYVRSGTVEIALDDERRAHLDEARTWLAREGVAHEWIEPAALTETVPAVHPSARAGLVISGHGFVAVPSLVTALVHSARFAGAVFEQPVDVVSIDPSPGHPVVMAGVRRWTPDAVVVAAGSWSGRIRIAGLPRLPVRPVRGQLLHLDWTGGHQPDRVVWGPDCYAVPWRDGSLIVGATVEDAGFDESATVNGVHALTAAVARLLPAATSASLREVRVGLRPAMPDGLPAIGAIAPSVIVATGHYRNGILLAPLTADLVSRLLLDAQRDPALDLVDPLRNLDGGESPVSY